MKKKGVFFVLLLLVLTMGMSVTAEAAVRRKGSKLYLYSGKGKLLKNGLKVVKGKTYYVNKKGVIQTGWIRVGKKKHYFQRNGVMAAQKWVGKKYVNKNGVVVKNKKSKIQKLDKKLRDYIKKSCVSGTWSVYVKNLDTGASLSINNQKMLSCCIIKMYAMAAAFDQVERGKISYSSVQNLIHPMITVSSNVDFNSLVRIIGKTDINKFCKKYGYTQTNQANGIGPAYNRDGLENGTGLNMTSVKDCGKLLEDMYNGFCVSKSASKKMLDVLKQQRLRSQIPSGVPYGTVVGNKTGSYSTYKHDAAIIYSPKCTYILCIMTNTGNPSGATSGFRGISKMVYDYFN